MADRKSVRAELERKRIQLAQMKEERERRSRMRQEDENSIPTSTAEGRDKLNEDADAVLQSFGLSNLSRASTAPSNVSTMHDSLTTSAGHNTSHIIHSNNQSSASFNSYDVTNSLTTTQGVVKRNAVPLQVVHVNQISIPPKERVYYTKSTQTFDSSQPLQQHQTNNVGSQQQPAVTPERQISRSQSNYYGKQKDSNATTTKTIPVPSVASNQKSIPRNSSVTDSLPSTAPLSIGANQLALEWDDEFPVLTDPYVEDEELSSDFQGRHNKSTSTGHPHDSTRIKGDDNFEVGERMSEHTDVCHTTDEERHQIELREDYQKFIDRATRVLARALYQNESSDIFIQYFPDGGSGEVDNDLKSNGKLSYNRTFSDERWSKNRCVTGFDWSTQYPELLLASYHSNELAPSDPDGTMLVWNMKFKNTTPEYVFHCQSPIISCCFAKFHPSLIVGGTYSGQIALWDMRSNKKTPVQRSPLTAAAHTHPIYCAKVVGSQNAHNLISVSTDGKLCSWSLDMLSAPQETMELNQQKQTRSIAVTCMSFYPDDYNNFLVGSEEGAVYAGCRHGSKTGILSSFDCHQGLVTAVDFRPSDTQTSYSHLYLTSSIDWTIKLWDTKDAVPIHSFESNCDYIYDVKWSPVHPGLFASVDGVGRVDIWNLFNDSELPTASTTVEGQPSLNKLIWTPSGNQVVVGSDEGLVHVYDIGDVGSYLDRPQSFFFDS